MDMELKPGDKGCCGINMQGYGYYDSHYDSHYESHYDAHYAMQR